MVGTNIGDYNYLNTTATAGYAGTATALPPLPKTLDRKNFKAVEIKGSAGKHYFSFLPSMGGIEITIEPCMNGFDVGIYKVPEPYIIGRSGTQYELQMPKECTNTKEFANTEDMIKEIYGTAERSTVAWEKAINLANDFYRMWKNESKVKKWGIGGEQFIQDNPTDYTNVPYKMPTITTTGAGTHIFPDGSYTTRSTADSSTMMGKISIDNSPISMNLDQIELDEVRSGNTNLWGAIKKRLDKEWISWKYGQTS